MRFFEFNGTKSSDLGLHIYSTNWFSTPERDYTAQSVPGRDGDLILDQGRYKNLLVKYECDLISPASVTLANRIKRWLMVHKYLPLSDFGDPEHFRYAIPVKPFSDATEESIWFGSALFQFNCKPYRYMVTGKSVQTFENPDSIELNNPGLVYSCPVFELETEGDISLTCSGKTMNLLNTSGTLVIDTDNKLIYDKNSVANLAAHNATDEFIYFEPGNNTLTFIGNVVKAKITPNWRTL